MAVGDGGFSTQMGGFNKNEVNEYISNLRKKMSELEAELKDNDDKVKAAAKISGDAENKIRKITQECGEKVEKLELQLKTEHRNCQELQNQVDDLKRKLRNNVVASGASGASDAARNQAAEIIAEAEKAARDTVEAANKTALEVVEKAKQSAREIVGNAQDAAGSKGVSSANIDGLMDEIRGYLERMNAGFREICGKFGEISDEKPEASTFEIPDFSDVKAPSAEAPAAVMPETEAAETDIAFGNIDETEFTGDLMGGFGSIDEPVSEISENDTSHHSKAAFDLDFDKELISQTVPSSSLSAGDIDEDLLSAVRAEEEKYAVQPSDGRDDFEPEKADDGLDAMQEMLKAAEAAFGGALDLDADSQLEVEPEAEPADSANPWEDLQKQLEAMEKGGFAEEKSSASFDLKEEAAPAEIDDPEIPSADDASIWNFSPDGDVSSGDDDDMSSDVFGSL